VNHGYFATELIQGEELCLEYYQPGETKMLPQIHMYGMDYAYRGVEFLDGYRTTGESRGICEVNVNCPEGSNWQEEKKGVNRIKIMKGGSGYWCTGSLVNNVRGDFMPYILTADHCGYGASTADLQQWIFYFGYEAATCQGITSTSKSLTGATLKAHGGSQGDTGSDFYLVKLDQKIPDTFDVVFNGWNRKDTTSPSGVCIHHPWGDIKKISTYNVPLTTAIYGGNPNPCFWEVSWIQTTNGHGVTEPGSSGSPLLDNFGRIVGTLTGGDSSCDSAYLDSPDYYGKFSWSWSSDGVDSTARLMDWLDPDHTGIMSLDKLTMGVTEHPHPIIVKIFPNPFTDFITLEIQGAHSSAAAMEVVDLLGVTRWSGTLPVLKGAPVSVSLTGLASGMYILRLHADGSVTTLKMIKK